MEFIRKTWAVVLICLCFSCFLKKKISLFFSNSAEEVNKLGGGGSAHSPWQSGGHVEQETPPLLSLVELPDSRRPVSASTHKPESDNRHTTTIKTAATRHQRCRNEIFTSSLHLSPEWQNWMLSTLSCANRRMRNFDQ